MRMEIVTRQRGYGANGGEISVKKIKLIPENPSDRKQLQDLFWHCRYGKPPVITTSIDTDKWDECTLILEDRPN